MIETLLLGISLFAAFSSGCRNASVENFDRETRKTAIQAVPSNTPKANEQSKTSLRTASFQGISFQYDPQIFGEAVPEEVAEQILENETDKPDDVHPRHIRFTFKKRNRKTDYTIEVFPIEDYRRIWKNAGQGNQAAFEEKLSAVGKAVKDKNYRDEGGQMPYLPFADASQMFVARAKNLSFRNGSGVFFLTQFTQEFGNLVNNDELSLIYQGISKNGRYYVLAEFPVAVDFLPNRYADEFEDYQVPQTDEEVKKSEKLYRQYLTKITARIENLSPDKFQPVLRSFEGIISTLEIENKGN